MWNSKNLTSKSKDIKSLSFSETRKIERVFWQIKVIKTFRLMNAQNNL